MLSARRRAASPGRIFTILVILAALSTGYVVRETAAAADSVGVVSSVAGSDRDGDDGDAGPATDARLMVAADGGVFNFSSLPFSGSLGGRPPVNPVVSVAPLAPTSSG